MAPTHRDIAEEELLLLGRDDPLDSTEASDDDYGIELEAYRRPRPSPLRSCLGATLRPYRSVKRHRLLQKVLLLRFVLYAFIAVVIFTYFFVPSYATVPAHYKALEARVAERATPGRGNPRDEKVFVAVSLYDEGGELAGGRWGRQLLELVDLIGPNNVFVSIYENDNGPEGESALRDLQARLPCENEVVYEEVDKAEFPRITMPDGEERLKRIMYLSEIRNRSLRPLNARLNTTYDRVLFLNDVYYNPLDALHLLFSTNMDADGRADYLAVCGLDYYFSSWKFYDTYATRDFGGYSMGVPIYPFFSSAGDATSRGDVLALSDAVRIKSCWSGMAAFDAKYLQSTADAPLPGGERIGGFNIDPEHPAPVTNPARFRAEPEPFFDACECCLLMADVLQLARGTTEAATGIYMNPYVRVAYHEAGLWRLRHTARVERLLSWVQWAITAAAKLPTFNYHRSVGEGDAFVEEVWRPRLELPAGGEWELANRTGRNGMYCGVREMQVIRLNERTQKSNWEDTEIPGGRQLF